jgi:hypothetical protein
MGGRARAGSRVGGGARAAGAGVGGGARAAEAGVGDDTRVLGGRGAVGRGWARGAQPRGGPRGCGPAKGARERLGFFLFIYFPFFSLSILFLFPPI